MGVHGSIFSSFSVGFKFSKIKIKINNLGWGWGGTERSQVHP